MEGACHAINPPSLSQLQGSVWKVLPRSIQILLKKEDGDMGFWERLLKDKQLEKTNVKVGPFLRPAGRFRAMHGWMDAWMDGWMDGWMCVRPFPCDHGWMDGWMDGWMVCVSRCCAVWGGDAQCGCSGYVHA